jgi:hypothetical protein
LLFPFLDGELEVDKNVAMLKHLELCAPCQERCDAERKLQETLTQAASEPLDEVTRARLLRAALAPRRPLWPFVTAAALLMVAAGWFLLADPFCMFGCLTEQQLERVVLQARTSQAVDPPEDLVWSQPTCVGCDIRADGKCHLVAPARACAKVPVWDYSSVRGKKKFGYVRLPGAHAHTQTVHEDGRRFFEGTLKCGVRYVGWEDPRGGIGACVGQSNCTANDLYVLATAIRNGER